MDMRHIERAVESNADSSENRAPTGFFQGGELVSGAVSNEGIGSGGRSTSHSVFGVTDAVGRGLSKASPAWVRESPFAGRI